MSAGMVLYEMHFYDHVMAGIVCVLAPVLAFTSRRIATEDIKLESADKIRLYHSNAMLLVVFALIVTTMWRLPGRSLEGLGLDLVTFHPAVPLLLIAIIAFYFLDIFLQYGNRRWREKTLQRRHKTMTFIPANGNEMVHFLLLAVAAGISEEIIFRGYLINYLLDWFGNSMEGIVAACLFSSALFAFLHGYQGISSMFKILYVALLFCAIFVLTRSLIIVIIVHTLMDMVSGILNVYVLKNLRQEPE